METSTSSLTPIWLRRAERQERKNRNQFYAGGGITSYSVFRPSHLRRPCLSILNPHHLRRTRLNVLFHSLIQCLGNVLPVRVRPQHPFFFRIADEPNFSKDARHSGVDKHIKKG